MKLDKQDMDDGFLNKSKPEKILYCAKKKSRISERRIICCVCVGGKEVLNITVYIKFT